MTKKADMSFGFIAGMIVMILVLLFYTGTLNKVFGSASNAIWPCEQVKGDCVPTPALCTKDPETGEQRSVIGLCEYKQADKKKQGMCCVTETQKQEAQEILKNSSAKENTPIVPQTGDTIEIRLGESTTKIDTKSTRTLNSGLEYQYHFWGEGPNAKTCTIKILDKVTGQPAEIEGITQQTDPKPCDGEKNKITLKFNHTEQNAQNLELSVRLFNEKNEQVQSAVLTLILDPTEFDDLETRGICRYTSCDQIRLKENCKDPTSFENCEPLNCQWKFQQAKCEDK